MSTREKRPELKVSTPERVIPSDVVRCLPGMGNDTAILTSYRADGKTPYLRLECPVEAVAAFAIVLETYTIKYDVTRVPRCVELLK